MSLAVIAFVVCTDDERDRCGGRMLRGFEGGGGREDR